MRDLINIVEFLTESVQGDVQGQMKVGPVLYDQKNGIGEVPDQQKIDYLGFLALMTPSQFFNLVPTRDFSETGSNIAGLKSALENGKSFASPFMEIMFDEDDPSVTPKIRSHEGRTRAKAIEELYGNILMPVSCFLGGGSRARHITLDHIASFRHEAIPEKTKVAKIGPHCDSTVWFLGGWKNLSN